MKQPIGIAPITVPSVAATYDGAGQVAEVFIDRLVTRTGPAGYVGRHAWMLLSASQAEALVYELAAKLGLEVTP